jgi:hypothetical protein
MCARVLPARLRRGVTVRQRDVTSSPPTGHPCDNLRRYPSPSALTLGRCLLPFFDELTTRLPTNLTACGLLVGPEQLADSAQGHAAKRNRRDQHDTSQGRSEGAGETPSPVHAWRRNDRGPALDTSSFPLSISLLSFRMVKC